MNKLRSLLIIIAVAAVAILLLNAVATKSQSPEPSPDQHAKARPEAVTAAPAAPTYAATGLQPDPVDLPPPAVAPPPAPANFAAEVVGAEQTVKRAEMLLATLEAMVSDNVDGLRDQDINQIQQQLADLAGADDRVLTMMCTAYFEDPDAQQSQFIRQVLGTIRHPAVEGLGLALVANGEREQVIAGLDLIAELGIPNRNTFVPILQLMEQEDIDIEILSKSVQSLRPMALPQAESDRLLARLGELTRHENLGVRIESLFATARWAKSGTAVAPVVDALDSEIHEERVSAMMALKESTQVSEPMRGALLGILADTEEEWFLRRMAFDSLQRFELAEQDFLAVERFGETIEDILQGGPVPGEEAGADVAPRAGLGEAHEG